MTLMAAWDRSPAGAGWRAAGGQRRVSAAASTSRAAVYGVVTTTSTPGPSAPASGPASPR
jgi:hypothetical protein